MPEKGRKRANFFQIDQKFPKNLGFTSLFCLGTPVFSISARFWLCSAKTA
jgi:hypothetical protein